MTRCRACAQGRCEDCQSLSLHCDCCRYGRHDDPCDCDDCVAAAQHQDELDFETLREDTP
jgi:predicted HD phosphohydrolase